MFLAILLATTLGQSSQVPVPVEIRVPEYPESAVKARITGLVEVTAVVSPDGTVTSVAASPNAPPIISASAVRAAREWRFAAGPTPEGRLYVIRFEFSVDLDSQYKGDQCFVGPATATVLLPLQTVRVRGWLRQSTTTPSGTAQ